MAFEEAQEAEVFLESLRASVGDRLLSLTPVETQYGTVMAAARDRSRDYLLPVSYEPTVATISLAADNRVALEYHTRQVDTVNGETVALKGMPDAECFSYLIDDQEVVSRRGGRFQGAFPTPAMFSMPWDGRTGSWEARNAYSHIRDVVTFLQRVSDLDDPHRSDDIFDRANIEARRLTTDILSYRAFVPSERASRWIGHQIVDRAAWVALQELR